MSKKRKRRPLQSLLQSRFGCIDVFSTHHHSFLISVVLFTRATSHSRRLGCKWQPCSRVFGFPNICKQEDCLPLPWRISAMRWIVWHRLKSRPMEPLLSPVASTRSLEMRQILYTLASASSSRSAEIRIPQSYSHPEAVRLRWDRETSARYLWSGLLVH